MTKSLKQTRKHKQAKELIVRGTTMVITKESLRSATKSSTSRPTTLADMPDEVCEQILRNTSSRPSHPEWIQFVTVEDVISSFKTTGALSRAARRIFTRIASDFADFGNDGNSVVLRSDDITEKSNCAFLRLMKTAGNVITQISLKDNDLATIGEEGREILLHSCKNVSKAMLRLRSNLDLAKSRPDEDTEEDDFDIFSFLRKFMYTQSGILKTLHLHCGEVHKMYIDAIAEYGVGIEELRIECYELFNDSDAIWKTVGPTLKTLKIEILDRVEEEKADAELQTFSNLLTEISENCVALRRLTVRVTMPSPTTTKTACRSVLRACEAYGAQLEYLCLDFEVPHELLASICYNCPNAHIDIWVPIEGFSAQPLRTLENSVCTLDYSLEDKYKYGNTENEEQKKNLVQKVEQKHFISAASGCRYLEKIIVQLPGVVAGPILDAFLSTPKESLRHVKLDLYLDPLFYDRHVRAIMKVLSKPNRIETFTLAVACAKLQSFDDFAKASLRLRKVHITFKEELDFDDFDALYLDIIRAFSQCPKLESLVIENPCVDDLVYSTQPTGEVNEGGAEILEYSLQEDRKPDSMQSKNILQATKKLRSRGVYIEVNYVPYC